MFKRIKKVLTPHLQMMTKTINNAASKAIGKLHKTQYHRKEDVITNEILYAIAGKKIKFESFDSYEKYHGTDFFLAFRKRNNGKTECFYLFVQAKVAENKKGAFKAHIQKEAGRTPDPLYDVHLLNLLYLGKIFQNPSLNPQLKYYQWLKNWKAVQVGPDLLQLEARMIVSKTLNNVLPLELYYCFWNRKKKKVLKSIAKTHSVLYTFSDYLYLKYRKNNFISEDLSDHSRGLFCLNGSRIFKSIFTDYGFAGLDSFENIYTSFKNNYRLSRKALNLRDNEKFTPYIYEEKEEFFARNSPSANITSEIDGIKSNFIERFSFEIEQDDSKIELIKSLGFPITVVDL